jgi:type II secretory pathway component GspD/PulD (secretin)
LSVAAAVLLGPASASAQSNPKDASVQITVIGNQLLITCDDPQVLAATTEMLHFLLGGLSSGPQIEVIKLKHAEAVEAASLLDQLYNGLRQPVAPLPEGDDGNLPVESGGRSRRRAASAAPVVLGEGRIRVVPDPTTNSLLVRATPLDILGIRRLLDTVIDITPPDSAGLMRVWVLPPLKNTSAPRVAEVLRDVFRQQMNDSVNLVRGVDADDFNGPGGGRARGSNRGGGRSTQAVTLSIGVDAISNTIVLSCSEKTKDTVRQLVEQLDTIAKDSLRTVQVVRVDGMDPQLVQRALDVLQGRRTFGSSGSNTGPSIPVIDAPRRGSPSAGNSPVGMPGLGGLGSAGFPAPGGAP